IRFEVNKSQRGLIVGRQLRRQGAHESRGVEAGVVAEPVESVRAAAIQPGLENAVADKTRDRAFGCILGVKQAAVVVPAAQIAAGARERPVSNALVLKRAWAGLGEQI